MPRDFYLPAPVGCGLLLVEVWWNQLKGDLWLAWVVASFCFFCFLLWAVLVVDLESLPEPAPWGREICATSLRIWEWRREARFWLVWSDFGDGFWIFSFCYRSQRRRAGEWNGDATTNLRRRWVRGRRR